MQARSMLSIVAASAGIAFAMMPGQASAFTVADDHITQAQVDAVHSNETRDEVISALGTPRNITSWMDGSRSMVYETYDALDGLQHVYVDLDKEGKVTTVEVFRDYD